MVGKIYRTVSSSGRLPTNSFTDETPVVTRLLKDGYF